VVDAAAWCASVEAAAHAFVPPDALDADRLTVEGADGRHLARVRRLGPGEVVTVADGSGRWRPCRIAAVEGDRLLLDPTGPTAREPLAVPPLAVAFAPAKGDQPEQVVAALTELGVDEIIPVTTTRTVVRWSGDRAVRAGDRLRRIARGAAEQSRRARLPEVRDPAPLSTLRGRPDLLVAARGGAGPESVGRPGPGGWTLLVGPEGGLDPDEVAALGPAEALGVGPHILRAATAPVAAVGLLWAVRSNPA
jgi:16S rRNA (uracil1498-N3)-methyltransferase